MSEPERCKAFPECKIRIKGNRYCAKHRCTAKNCEIRSTNYIDDKHHYCNTHNTCQEGTCTNINKSGHVYCEQHIHYKCQKIGCYEKCIIVQNGPNHQFCPKHSCALVALQGEGKCYAEAFFKDAAGKCGTDHKDHVPFLCIEHKRILQAGDDEADILLVSLQELGFTRFVQEMDTTRYNVETNYTAPNTASNIFETLLNNHMTRYVDLDPINIPSARGINLAPNPRIPNIPPIGSLNPRMFDETRISPVQLSSETLVPVARRNIHTTNPVPRSRGPTNGRTYEQERAQLLGLVGFDGETTTTTTTNTKPTAIVKCMEITSESTCCICLDQLINQPFKSYTCVKGAMHGVHSVCQTNLETQTADRSKICTLCV